ncbi:MAG: DUF4962 domain-containing protein [Candidatus Latescibacterota bacterium]
MMDSFLIRFINIVRGLLGLNAFILLPLVGLFPHPAHSTPVISHTFQSSTRGWKAANRSVNLRIERNENTDDSFLRITAKSSKSDTLAVFPLFPLSGFQKYRLSAKVSAPAETIPALVCDCLLGAKTGSLGVFATEPAGTPTGDWRQMSVEFRAPWGTSAGRLMLVVRGEHRSPSDIVIRMDDVVLEPIESYATAARYLLNPMPEKLSRLRGIHPRLYLNRDTISELKRKAGTTHNGIWKKLQIQADGLVKQPPPAYPEKVADTFDEQWWQARNAFSMTTLAFAYLISEDKQYLDAAVRWALTTCRYPHWGVGWSTGRDCMAGQNLFGLALVYDWCYRDMEPDVREEIRQMLIERGGVLFQAAAQGNIVPDAKEFTIRPWPEWEEAWLQNHLWVNACGLAAAGFALYGEHEGAESWIAFAAEKFGKTLKLLGPDGASHEGINYWSYGVEHLLKYMYLSRELLGVELFDNSWLRITAAFRLYSGIPSGDWRRDNTAIDYADSYRRDYTGPDFLLHALAAEYRDGYAQWLAQELDDAGVQISSWKWLDLLWYDPSVPPEPPTALPTMRHFADMDFVSMRSDWSDGSFVFFQCGPYIGHQALREMPYCASSAHHTHPDRNHFVLHGAGEWLLRDDGNRGKYTGQHNTLLIDGGEQLGGGDSIFDGRMLHALKAAPRILKAEHTEALDHIVGEAAAAYPPETGLKRFRRHLLFLKPDVLIVLDDIQLANNHDLELRFHPEQQTVERRGNTLIMNCEKSKFSFSVLTPTSAELSAEQLPLIDRRFAKDEFLTIRLRHNGKIWRNAVAFSWSEKSSGPVPVSLQDDGNVWIFKAGSKTVRFDWETENSIME